MQCALLLKEVVKLRQECLAEEWSQDNNKQARYDIQQE